MTDFLRKEFIHGCFSVIDNNENGKITVAEVQRTILLATYYAKLTFVQLGAIFGPANAEFLMNAFDTNSDEELTYVEFEAFMDKHVVVHMRHSQVQMLQNPRVIA